MKHILNLTLEELKAWAAERELSAFRVKQIRRWIHQGRITSFDEMSDLPKALRSQLAESFQLFTTEISAHRGTGDGTEKLLLKLSDGEQIECVLIRERDRRTICISTQVGCGMGCVFCASGLNGVARNLTTGEIVEQVLRLEHLLPKEERLTNVVVMGMGEPLANLDALLPTLQVINSPDGFHIGARKITISTVGLPKSILRLAELKVPYLLAVSLHAPNDELRNRLVKVNKNIGIQPILAAAQEFFHATGRRVTFEYVMLADQNDQPEHARELAQLLQGENVLVNLIPYNPVDGLPYQTPSGENVRIFVDILEQAHIQVQVRKRKGDRINAACGQLRREQKNDLVQL